MLTYMPGDLNGSRPAPDKAVLQLQPMVLNRFVDPATGNGVPQSYPMDLNTHSHAATGNGVPQSKRRVHVSVRTVVIISAVVQQW